VKNWQHKLWLSTGLFFATSLAVPVFAQQSNTLQPAALRAKSEAAPKSKPKKVWTEDSITEVRTRADNYLDGKDAASNANTGKMAGSAPVQAADKSPGSPPLLLHIPETGEETQKAIDQRRSLADTFHTLLSNTQERLAKETDPQVRATLEEKAKLLNVHISTTNSEIKALEKALDDYQHGKTPEQPKAEGQAKIPNQGKPAEQAKQGSSSPN